MANAAAKKAAKAKQETTSFYKPVLLALNLLHLLFLFLFEESSLSSTRTCLLTLLEWILTYTCYKGIVHASQLGSRLTGGKEGDLKGGVYLDILGLVLIVQFGSVLISTSMDYLLIVLPVGYIWKKFFKKDGDSTEDVSKEADDMDEDAKKQLEERRRKRAERRRQKRA